MRSTAFMLTYTHTHTHAYTRHTIQLTTNLDNAFVPIKLHNFYINFYWTKISVEMLIKSTLKNRKRCSTFHWNKSHEKRETKGVRNTSESCVLNNLNEGKSQHFWWFYKSHCVTMNSCSLCHLIKYLFLFYIFVSFQPICHS